MDSAIDQGEATPTDSAGDLIHLDFELMQEEFVQAKLLYHFRKPRQWGSYFAFGAFMSFNSVYLFSAGSLLLSLFGLVSVVVLISYPWTILPIEMRNAYKRLSPQEKRVVCTITHKYLEISGPISSARFHNVFDVEADDELALMCIGPQKFVPIPARACESQSQFLHILRFLEQLREVDLTEPTDSPIMGTGEQSFSYKLSREDLLYLHWTRLMENTSFLLVWHVMVAFIWAAAIFFAGIGDHGMFVLLGIFGLICGISIWVYPRVSAACQVWLRPHQLHRVFIAFTSDWIVSHDSAGIFKWGRLVKVERYRTCFIMVHLPPDALLTVPRFAFDSDEDFEEAYRRASAFVPLN